MFLEAAGVTTFWEDLLEYIDEGRVIPIVGSELLSVPHEGGEQSLLTLVARRLAARLGVGADNLPKSDALHAVICRHLERGGRREEIYPRLRAAMKEAPLPTPPALARLARIRHFKLFITTTFDGLMEQALNEERFAGSAKLGVGATGVQSIAYSPNNVQDLPCPVSELDRPTVFHLLGRLSSVPEYALTEEDVLEFLYALQTDKKRPEVLFDELRTHHLLLIGNRFPDWLARFFIRLAKGSRLSGQRDTSEVLADGEVGRDSRLIFFLKNFSYHTQIYLDGGANEFVNDLADRYLARHPPDRAAAPGSLAAPVPTEAADAAGDTLPPGAVFLSYASEDQQAVARIHDALQSAGIDVWFDRRRLEAGDDYSFKLRRNIKACSLFVPVVSTQTEARLEGFFRLEWRWAVERGMQIADEIPFIIPVTIDDTHQSQAMVPEKFREVQWSRLPGGEVTPEFVRQMVGLLREQRTRLRGLT